MVPYNPIHSQYRGPLKGYSRDPRKHSLPNRGPRGRGHSAVERPLQVYRLKATSGMTSGVGLSTFVAGDSRTMGMDASRLTSSSSSNGLG